MNWDFIFICFVLFLGSGVTIGLVYLLAIALAALQGKD